MTRREDYKMGKHYIVSETTTEATHYYAIAPLDKVIPKTKDAQEVLTGLLLQSKRFDLPAGVDRYPIITRAQLEMFPSFVAVQVKITYLKTRPSKEHVNLPPFTAEQLNLLKAIKKA